MKKQTIFLCGLLLASLQSVSGIEATLKHDMSLPNREKPRDYYPSAPRLRISSGETTYLVYNIGVVLPEGTVPEDISKAVLRIWVNSTKDFSPGVCEIYRSAIWDERYSKGNDPGLRPALGAMFTRFPVERSNQYYTIDVTALVKEYMTIFPGNQVYLPIALKGNAGSQADIPRLPLTHLNAWTDSKENRATTHEPTLQLLVKSR